MIARNSRLVMYREEGAQHAAGHHGGAGLVHAAGGHALVGRLDDHGDASRLQHLIEGIGDLHCHLFLDLQPAGIDIHEPGKLGDTDHPPAGEVGDCGLPMMGTMWCSQWLSMRMSGMMIISSKPSIS